MPYIKPRIGSIYLKTRFKNNNSKQGKENETINNIRMCDETRDKL